MNNDARDEVRSRLAIEDIVGEYVQLKRAGRNWKGISPFTAEKTPSFFVSPDKGIWHDFSSNQGGDIFSFIMMVEGLDFRGALEMLARKAGVDLSMYDSGSSKEHSEKKRRLRAINESAATFFQRCMIQDKEAIAYVQSRGLDRTAVHEFRIGYAPKHEPSLVAFLEKKGYDRREIRDAGVANSRGGDLFRERMMVPLSDSQGQIVGFTGRIAGDVPNAPKYLNTPQTMLYDKGRQVFGLFQAKPAIREVDYAVIVEGNLDVVSSHQAGVKQVVATAGTAMTEHHLKTLSRLTNDIRLCFDSDKAGVAATERAIPIAQRVGVELSIITLPDGFKDPDELIQSDPGRWATIVEVTRPAIEWVIDQYEARNDMSSAAGKRQLTTETMKLLKAVDNPVEREHYFGVLSKKTGASLGAITERFSQHDLDAHQQRLKPVKTTVEVVKGNVQQDYLLALMTIEDGAIDVAKDLGAEYFDGMERQAFYTYMLGHRPVTISADIPEELQDIETYVKIVLLKAETRYETLDGQERLVEAVSLVEQLKRQHRTKQKQRLTEALRESESAHDDAESTRIRTALNALIKED